MKTVALIFALLGATVADKTPPCFKRNDAERAKQNPTLHLQTPLEPVATLPENFSWGNVNGVNYLTEIKNQHIPSYCGSCWAQGASSAMSDRIKIVRKAAWPDINIAPQVLISCEMTDQGCHGGDHYVAYQWIHENYITDETCSIYRARGHDNGAPCDAQLKCNNCAPGATGCWAQDNYKIYGVETFNNVTLEEPMMQEILARGPIACGIDAMQSFDDFKGDGVFSDPTPTVYDDINHIISVVGWGVHNGVKFWWVRNSWGSAWGTNGFVKVERGVNMIQIEADCAWAVANDTWTTDVRHKNTPEENASQDKASVELKQSAGFLESKIPQSQMYGRVPFTGVEEQWKQGQRFEEVPSWEALKDAVMPDNLDWRNINGNNYCSWNKNQHIPEYCGSCWTQGPTSSLADRFNILLGATGSFTPVGLNAQYIINFKVGGGDCKLGGEPADVWTYAYTNGIVDSSCQQYVAHDFDYTGTQVTDMQVCKDCTWAPCPANATWWSTECQSNCWATTPNRMYYVTSHYSVIGKDQMQRELLKNGPMECSIQATDNFEKYTGGIYTEVLPDPIQLNHSIAVVGWGKDSKTGEDYWIGRNSWGTYWGESGFFQMKMGGDNLGIESVCTAGIPSLTKAPQAVAQEFIQ